MSLKCPQCGGVPVLDTDICAFVCPRCGVVVDDHPPETVFFSDMGEGFHTAVFHDNGIGTVIDDRYGVLKYRMFDASVKNWLVFTALKTLHAVILMLGDRQVSRCAKETGARILREIASDPGKYGLERINRDKLMRLAAASLLVSKVICRETGWSVIRGFRDTYKVNIHGFIDIAKRAAARLFGMDIYKHMYRVEAEYSLMLVAQVSPSVAERISPLVGKLVESPVARSLAPSPRLLVASIAYITEPSLIRDIVDVLNVSKDRVLEVSRALVKISEAGSI